MLALHSKVFTLVLGRILSCAKSQQILNSKSNDTISELTKNGLRSRRKCKCKRGYIGATCKYFSRAVLPDIPVFFASHSFSSDSESATIIDDSSDDEFSGNYLSEWINFNSLKVPRIFFGNGSKCKLKKKGNWLCLGQSHQPSQNASILPEGRDYFIELSIFFYRKRDF